MTPKNLRLVGLTLLIMLALAACGGSQGDDSAASAADQAVLDRGKLVFQANCSACHSTSSDAVLVGPSMVGIASRAGGVVNGLDARAYLEESILEPGAYVNAGFQNLMPNTYGNSLSAQDLEAVIAYLMTLE